MGFYNVKSGAYGPIANVNTMMNAIGPSAADFYKNMNTKPVQTDFYGNGQGVQKINAVQGQDINVMGNNTKFQVHATKKADGTNNLNLGAIDMKGTGQTMVIALLI